MTQPKASTPTLTLAALDALLTRLGPAPRTIAVPRWRLERLERELRRIGRPELIPRRL
jgi:hypothetical protein